MIQISSNSDALVDYNVRQNVILTWECWGVPRGGVMAPGEILQHIGTRIETESKQSRLIGDQIELR
jgi:hypothetical protein